jgi:PAS domain S-box-containing protein
VSVADVLITPELDRRPARAPDHAAENRALVALATVMAESPDRVFQALADAALELCRAGSAGVSVWEPGGHDDVFRWRGTAGDYAPYRGDTLPRHFSPCGTVVDCGRPLLMADPVRVFPYIADLCSPVREVLLVPFHQDGKAVGTVWVVAHTPDRHFDAEDARVVTSLTRFASAAVQALGRTVEAVAAERALRESEGRFATRLQLALDAGRLGTWEWDPETDGITLSGRAAEIYGVAPGVPHSREALRRLLHPDDRDRARAAVAQAAADRTGYEIEYRLDGAGEPVWVAARGEGVYGASGQLVRMHGVVQDVTERKRAESELRDIRSRMEAALEAGAIGTWAWDVATDRFHGDPSLARIFSVPPEAVAGGPLAGLMDAVHPDDRERVGALVARAVASGERYEADYRVSGGAGGWRWVTARGLVERDETGKPVRFPGVVIDITDRKRAEEALAQVTAESERRRRLYEAVLSSTPDLAYVWGLDHRFTYANEGLLRMWGKTWDEAIGRNCLELGYEPWHAAMHDREIDEVVVTRQPVRGEVPFTGTFGRRMYDYLLVPVIGANGEVEAVAGTTRDVTERKAFEEGLRKQTERLRLLWEAASVLLTTDEPDAMMRALFDRIAGHFGLDAYFNFMLDASGEFLHLESCIGVAPETVESIRRLELGQAVCGAVAQTRAPITATSIQQSDEPRVQLVKSFGIRAYACSPLIAGDRLLGTLSFASRTRDTFDADELEFLRTICHYVTVAYERLRLVRELRDQDRKKDDFIALLAHELRNPLAPIRNGLQVLRLAANDPATEAKARDIMDRQLGHMVRLIDDLLDISRVNRNKMELRRARVTLAEVIASAVEAARPLLEAAGHELTVSLPAAPVVLDADLTRLAQVFSNLLANSAKYTARGGRVWLSAERAEGHVVVSVRDTGVGIPEAFLPTIFDMFSQVDRSVERSSGGLGIGLALVRGLVEMHGGTVTADSPGEGLGSTFTVRLPALAVGAVEDATTIQDVSHRAGRRVLVADDNRDGAESMADMLRLLGYEVATAHDGLEALERARVLRPDVVLMDVGMPRLNGLDATRRIRAEDWARDITIIALTGWGQANDRDRTREAGCDAHLVKPVSLEALQRVLSEVAR